MANFETALTLAELGKCWCDFCLLVRSTGHLAVILETGSCWMMVNTAKANLQPKGDLELVQVREPGKRDEGVRTQEQEGVAGVVFVMAEQLSSLAASLDWVESVLACCACGEQIECPGPSTRCQQCGHGIEQQRERER